MDSNNRTRREFLKQGGAAFAAVTTSGFHGFTEETSSFATFDKGDKFELIVEVSGMWFLALRDKRVRAYAIPLSLQGQSAGKTDENMTHYPRLFVSKANGAMGGTNDVNEKFTKYEIKSSIWWPDTVPMVDQDELPKHITNFTKLIPGVQLDQTALASAYQLPLSFDKPKEIFPNTKFKYEAIDGTCKWKGNIPLAWKLVYKKTLPGNQLALKFDGGPPAPFTPDSSGQIKLIFRNTILKYSKAADPEETDDDSDKYASHFIAHYHFLKGVHTTKCYPLRTEKGRNVSGLYTCMFGGGGGG